MLATCINRAVTRCRTVPLGRSHSALFTVIATPGATRKMSHSVDTDKLYREVTAMVADYLSTQEKRDSKVIDFRLPAELRQLVDITLPEEPQSEEAILQCCRDALKYCVHTCHPRFYNQLFGGVDHVGLVGQLITAATNTSMYTFEMAPLYSLMEAELLQRLRERVGWENGDGDGIFAPGGSIANLYGLMMARYHKYPESKEKGNWGLPRLAILASEQSHYSLKKSAIIMGLGTESVVAVKSDERARMDTQDLEKKIAEVKEKGMEPFAVVATSGTTVVGAFDPLNAIADICEKYNIWIHVDAAFGGSCMISDTHRRLMNGSERMDSITWDMHKSLSAHQQCSVILISPKHKGILAKCNSTRASYLFQQDKMNYDVTYDTGDKSIQCGRVNDTFKFWLTWKAKGTKGFGQHIDNSVAMARYLADQVIKRDGFELIFEPEYTNVCFQYIPPCLRGQERTKEWWARLGKVPPQIKSSMVQQGTMMIGYQPLMGRTNFIRMVTTNPHATQSDMDFILNEVERLGRDIAV